MWLWTDPWEPQVEVVTIRGYSIQATATPTQVTWSMGDGGSVTCGSAGTTYTKSYGFTESPDCGYMYEKTSGNQPGQAFTVTADMLWDVTWVGAASGSTTTNTTESADVRIGEYQTVIER